MDVLGINQQMQKSDWLVFISTMGNANTCASYVTMALVGAICYYCVAKNIKAKVFAGISIVNCSMALITARSDSAFVGSAVIIVVLGVMAFVKKIEWKNYIVTLVLVDLGLLVLFILRERFIEHLLMQAPDDGVAGVLNKLGLLTVMLIALVVVYCAFYVIDKKKIQFKKNIRYGIYIVVSLTILILILFIVYKLDIIQLFRTEIGKSHGVASRAGIYRRVVKTYEQLPLINKVFGCGQATIRSVLHEYFGQELSKYGVSINSAHNHILDYIIMLGGFGVLCYVGVIFSSIKHGFKSIRKNEVAIVFVGCVIAYFAQGFFNIEQTNTTPIFWLMVACCEATYRKNVMKKEEC